jgi:heme-degrading monooxygenase HmoA
MAVVILIKRTVPVDKVKEVIPLFRKLRRLSMERPGYISGATLNRVDKPNEYLVISTWQMIDDWQEWAASEERKQVQGEIEALIGTETEYEIYDYRLPGGRLME